jgi:hypothetical protein
MTTTASGTATAAKIFLTLTLLQSPTVSPILNKLDQPTSRIQRTTTQWPSADSKGDSGSAAPTQTTSVSAIRQVTQLNELGRPTTSREKLIGEVRRWGLLNANWDGEGAAPPVASSLKEAVSFVNLLDEADTLPEPMLHASGHAGLFWKDDSLYADIEFLGNGRIAYYIEYHGDKHKGVLGFDSKKMPAVFPALLRA